jgi:hypothetical protein
MDAQNRPVSLIPRNAMQCRGLIAWIVVASALGCGRSEAPSTSAAPALPILPKVGGFLAQASARPSVTDPLLKMSVTPQFEILRGQAPLNCFVRLQWQGAGLLEGRALLDIYAGNEYVGSWRSPEVAVTDQTLILPLMLPPSPLNNERDGYTLQAAFETEDKLLMVDSKVLAAEPVWSRRFLMGVIVPKSVTRLSGFTAKGGAPHAAEAFQLADFHPDKQLGSEFNVNLTIVEPADVPIEPLRMSAFDLLFLSEESLLELRTNQLEAIVRWARAGGRVCVNATGRVPAPLRPAWSRLLSSDPVEPMVTIDDDGRTKALAGSPGRLRIENGCGRVLCLLETAAVDEPAWTQDVEWIFSVLSIRSKEIAQTGHWETPQPVHYGPDYQRIRPFGPGIVPVDALMGPLLPNEVKGVSFWSVLLVLGTCLTLIGPVDYYVLGRLKMRRLTWVLLPLVALSATWGMVRMSQASLGSQSHSRSLAIADLGSDREVARVFRFELEYTPIETTRLVEDSGAYRIDFQAPIIGRDFSMKEGLRWQGNLSEQQVVTRTPVRYEGNVPGVYQFWEPMEQWTPRLFRETTFGPHESVPDEDAAAIDWTAVNEIDWTTDEGRASLAKLIGEKLPEAIVMLRTGLRTFECRSVSQPAEAASTPSEENQKLRLLLNTIADATSTLPMNAQLEPAGLFAMVHQRAPTCGPDLEDLNWIDPDNVKEAVLLIGVAGDHATIFRKKLTRP